MSKGLRGIEAGTTSICTVGETGDDLHYRGYDVVDLSEHCIFEEVCYLLLQGDLPNKDQLKSFTNNIISKRSLPEVVKDFAEKITKKNISLINRIDKEIVGGFNLKIGDRMIDCTVVLHLPLVHKPLTELNINK